MYVETKAWFIDGRFDLLNHADVTVTLLKFSTETGINEYINERRNSFHLNHYLLLTNVLRKIVLETEKIHRME